MSVIDIKYNFLKPLKNSNLLRLGRNHDGGYIVDSTVINKCNTLITFGLGPDWSFELDAIKRNKNIKIYMYDYSVSSAPYVKDVIKYFRRFLTFRSNYESVSNRLRYLKEYQDFFKIKNVTFFKEKIAFPVKEKIDVDIDKVFSRIPSEEKVILKSDIEGSEYEVIDQILNYSDRIEMLIFEFHWIDKKEEIFLESVKKLQKYFDIIHIHGNNHFDKLPTGLPIIIEMTLLNKKNNQENTKQYVTSFPIEGLDYSNNPHKEDLAFSFSNDQ
tara:strand:- start:239 stop:1051 length:813 start_codon:yes stop_codon:yes gene_type:complete